MSVVPGQWGELPATLRRAAVCNQPRSRAPRSSGQRTCKHVESFSLLYSSLASAHARTIKPHPPSRISILRVYIRPPPQRSRATELNCSTQLEGKNQDACYLLLHERHWEPGGKEIHTFTTRSCLHKFCEYSTFNCKSKWLATSFFWRWI